MLHVEAEIQVHFKLSKTVRSRKIVCVVPLTLKYKTGVGSVDQLFFHLLTLKSYPKNTVYMQIRFKSGNKPKYDE